MWVPENFNTMKPFLLTIPSLLFAVLGILSPGFAAEESDAPDLVRVRDAKEVYLIESGKRRLVPSLEIFEANGFDLTRVRPMSADELDSFPEGAVVGNPPQPYKEAVEGDLLQADRGTGTVYLVQNGKRRCITTRAVFDSWGFADGKIRKITVKDLEAIPAGEDVLTNYPSAREGDLLRSKDVNEMTVYLIQSGLRCRIPSEEVFQAKGFSWDKVLSVSGEDLSAIPEGGEIR